MTRPASRLTPYASRQRGFTIVELAVVAAMIAILTAMVVPVAKYTLKRQDEIELRYQLGRPNIGSRVAVALQAHAHVQRLLLTNLHHLVDPAVAAHVAVARVERRDGCADRDGSVVRGRRRSHPRGCLRRLRRIRRAASR